MSDHPFPHAMRDFPRLRQSLLGSFDDCALKARFDLLYRKGWDSHPQGRGQLLHRTLAKCLEEMHRHGEDQIDPDSALGILHEVLRQADVDEVCHEPGCDLPVAPIPEKDRKDDGRLLVCTAGHRHTSSVVNVPIREIKDLYWVVRKWAGDNQFDISRLVSIEERLTTPIYYPNPKGGHVERILTGQTDALFLDTHDAHHAVVLDFKDTWALPAPTEVSFEGYFQQRFYGLLVMRTYSNIQRVTLREFYVRFSEPREVTITRDALGEIEAELSALAERFDRAYEQEVFKPTPGKHCLGASTRFLTDEGVRTLGDAVGERVRVLDRHGEWTEGRVESFGVQPLLRVEFEGGEVVEATPDHRWWQRDGSRVTTVELERAPVARHAVLPDLDPEGVRHGIVYGDGHVYGRRNYAMVRLQPHKAELADWFDKAPVSIEHYPGQVIQHDPLRHREGAVVDVLLQPVAFKLLPRDCSPAYARGFIAGLIATDGHVSKQGSVVLDCEGRDRAERIAELARLGGAVVTGVRVNSALVPAEIGGVALRHAGEPREMCRVTLKPLTAPVIRGDQRKRLRPVNQMRSMYRRVVEVKEAGRAEVFCVVVPGSESFTLANGLVTSNCSYCPRPSKCPIPVFAREEGRIVDDESAQKVAAQLLVADQVVKKTTKALRAYAEEHGPIPVKNAKGESYYGFEESKRVARPDAAKAAQAQSAGIPVDTLYKTSKTSRFGLMTKKPKEDLDNPEILKAFEEWKAGLAR